MQNKECQTDTKYNRHQGFGKFNSYEDPMKTVREWTSLIWSIFNNSRTNCLGELSWLSNFAEICLKPLWPSFIKMGWKLFDSECGHHLFNKIQGK